MDSLHRMQLGPLMVDILGHPGLLWCYVKMLPIKEACRNDPDSYQSLGCVQNFHTGPKH